MRSWCLGTNSNPEYFCYTLIKILKYRKILLSYVRFRNTENNKAEYYLRRH